MLKVPGDSGCCCRDRDCRRREGERQVRLSLASAPQTHSTGAAGTSIFAGIGNLDAATALATGRKVRVVRAGACGRTRTGKQNRFRVSNGRSDPQVLV